MIAKRAQGRPARGVATVGPQKIVQGMQDALRSLKRSSVTRKDVAHFAGVTPALVTYYFPERDRLIRAATEPVIEQLTTAVEALIGQATGHPDRLLSLTATILQCYVKDIYIVELYHEHCKSLRPGEQNPLGDMRRSVTGFFNDWLSRDGLDHCDGEFLTNSLFGLCRSVAYHHQSADNDVEAESCIRTYARMISTMVMGGLSRFERDPTATPFDLDARDSEGQGRPPETCVPTSADTVIVYDNGSGAKGVAFTGFGSVLRP